MRPISLCAAAHGSVVPESTKPTKGNGCGVSAAEAVGQQSKTERSDSRSDGFVDQGPIPYTKRVSTCQAKLALLGFSMHPLVGDSFVIGKWGMSRTVADITDAEAFLARVGGAHG
jgi:hypothetical protein